MNEQHTDEQRLNYLEWLVQNDSGLTIRLLTDGQYAFSSYPWTQRNLRALIDHAIGQQFPLPGVPCDVADYVPLVEDELV